MGTLEVKNSEELTKRDEHVGLSQRKERLSEAQITGTLLWEFAGNELEQAGKACKTIERKYMSKLSRKIHLFRKLSGRGNCHSEMQLD